MPWTTDSVTQLKTDLETLIENEFGINPNTPVFLCTKEELIARIVTEHFFLQLPKEEQQNVKSRLEFVLGIYFADTHEIWVVHGESDNREVIFHELLHAIQKCDSHRENIVDYLSWRYLKVHESIEAQILQEWQEIERSVGFHALRERFLTVGDCEEF